jgi:hypothetical protein
MIILGANQERNSCLIEAPALAIPFLNGIQGTLAGKIEHEQNGHGVVANERQHVDELALATQIPDGKGNLSIANGNGLFHEIHAYKTW